MYESQKKASRNWEAKNPDKHKHASYRRSARLFINKHATLEDITELEELIENRKLELNQLEVEH
jgi:hypothetical protein